MVRRTSSCTAVAAMVLSSFSPFAFAQTGGSKPSFRTLALCLAAHERERGLAMDANARLTKAKFNSAEESTAMAEQNTHNAKATSIKQVCDQMERDERPMADQVKELTGLLDGLGPTNGSTRAPVAGVVRQHNLTNAGDKMEQLGGTLDQALADFRAASFPGKPGGPAPSPLIGKADPATGVAAASSLRADVEQWNRQEAVRETERRRLAAIEADRQRFAMAQLAEQRRIRAEAEAEEKASRRGGFWNTLGTIVGVGLGVAAARSGGASSAQASQALQNYANAQAMANLGRSSTATSGSTSSSCSLSSSDLDPEPPSTGNSCQDARATLAWAQANESRVRSCGNAQLTQYWREQTTSLRQYTTSVCS